MTSDPFINFLVSPNIFARFGTLKYLAIFNKNNLKKVYYFLHLREGHLDISLVECFNRELVI